MAERRVGLAALVHREMVQLWALIAVAAVAFFATRAFAAGNRRIAARDADEWFRRGSAAMSAGRLDEATVAFRRAAVRRRGNRAYALALARALAASGEVAAATRELLAV